QNLVKVIQASLPQSGYLARYGGEEFAILLGGIPIQVALQYLERFIQQVWEQPLEHLNRPGGKAWITVSVGATWIRPTPSYTDIHALMKAADVQLYLAKQTGRDQLNFEQGAD